MAEDVWICTQCGKNSPKETKFCSECGGSMEHYQADDIKFVCEKCGMEFKEKWNYCHDCAGKIVTMVPYVYTCGKCGAVLDEKTKFCPECGGKVTRRGGVIGKKAAPTITRVETVSQPEFCPGCGKNTLVKGFCTSCGYSKQ